MIDCPPLDVFEESNRRYSLLLDVLFCCNVCLNPYVMYCIIYRSSRYMNSYRWYLLYHQILGFISDISISCFTKPVFLLPFTAAYPMGIWRGIVPPRYMLMWCLGFITVNMAAVCHLFTFRYVTARGWRVIPKKYKISMVVIVIIALLPIAGVHLAYKDEKEILSQWAKVYACITPEIVAIPNLMAYDRWIITYYACIPLLFAIVIFIIAILFFIIQTYRAINLVIMSARLRKMQRLYLCHLIVQAFIPIFLIVTPGIVFILILIFKIYEVTSWSAMFFSVASTFSMIEAVVLIILNPAFRIWNWKKTTIRTLIQNCIDMLAVKI